MAIHGVCSHFPRHVLKCIFYFNMNVAGKTMITLSSQPMNMVLYMVTGILQVR